MILDTLLKDCYTLTVRRGAPRLYGNRYSLPSPGCPSMLLRKQTSYNETFQAKMQFNPRKHGYEAGIALWWSQFSHATIGITLVELYDGQSEKRVILRWPEGLLSTETRTMKLPNSSDLHRESSSTLQPFTLRIEAQLSSYKLVLSWRDVNCDFDFSASYLTVAPPVGSVYGGMLFGLYALGDGEPVLDPADFSDICILEG